MFYDNSVAVVMGIDAIIYSAVLHKDAVL